MKYAVLKYLFFILMMQVMLVKPVFSQEQDYYQYHLDRGNDYFDARNYVEALSQYELAKKYIAVNDEAKKSVIDQKTAGTRDAIIRLYMDSEIAKNKARAEKEKADSAKVEAVNARIVTQRSLAKTQKIINAFYFYEEQFALAYKNNKYGFINKEGDVVIDYKYEEARPFDYTGLSRVKRNNQLYLLDNKKTEYELAIGMNKLTTSSEALDLSNLQLATFPESIVNSANLKILLLNGNEISLLPPSIADLSQLKKLFIYNNKLVDLPVETGSLSGLTTLDASINKLLQLPGSISKLTNLEELVLYDNNLSDLPAGIGNLQKLFFLDVSNNLLVSLPAGIDSLGSLRILALGENQFHEFPPGLKSLRELIMLDLSGNYIREIPSWIEDLDMLTHLHVWNNQLVSLPDEMTELDSLKVLVAGSNQLVSLPPNMDSLAKLEELILNSNRLATIPPELGKMRELSKLDLRKNSGLDPGQILSVFKSSDKQLIISASDNDLDYMAGNRNLLLRMDPFRSIPGKLAEMDNLVALDLIHCPDISANDILVAFANYSKDIAYSSATYPQLADTNQLLINVDVVPLLSLDTAQARKVEKLDLSGRNLVEIPAVVFSLENLASLDLSGNGLAGIPSEMGGLTRLKELWLKGNPIQESEREKIKAALPGCEVYFDTAP